MRGFKRYGLFVSCGKVADCAADNLQSFKKIELFRIVSIYFACLRDALKITLKTIIYNKSVVGAVMIPINKRCLIRHVVAVGVEKPLPGSVCGVTISAARHL